MGNITPIDKEYIVEESVIISQTDLEGIITYVNRAFCETSGYKTDELIGQPHSIVRHPNMPKIEFSSLWSTLSGGQAWNGLMINLRKDGRFYWLDTEILPINSDEGEITGYIAVRKGASRKDINEVQEKYNKMLETQEQ